MQATHILSKDFLPIPFPQKRTTKTRKRLKHPAAVLDIGQRKAGNWRCLPERKDAAQPAL
jgi:hypothetical protein